ncbi:ergothioneine biosynthesis protein EgtB [Marinimicrobium sp. ARAG 43.8]|uniref:ergothioneine biosynthesis protein EgtB n=1 Tax=Marinimicrobium sp. ARAG 43.8 TaxID=3418719 RepID=UPI003CF62322
MGSLYRTVRARSIKLCEPLLPEDYCLQATKATSPPKWHLAHITWFFETFILIPLHTDYQPFHPTFKHLFNSYYNSVGDQFSRPQRGLLTRPTIKEVMAYRNAVDTAMLEWITTCPDSVWPNVAKLVELGCNHEEQHQELLLTDLKFGLSLNPLKPTYRKTLSSASAAPPMEWLSYPGGVHEVGHAGEAFVFDNERPRHKVYVDPYRLASRPVTNGEFLAFIEAGGYERPEYWLSDGFAEAQAQGWSHPLYWRYDDGQWRHFTLSGERDLNRDEPVTHLSFYEADAYARFRGARLPTEMEWELAANQEAIAGNFSDAGHLHPQPAQHHQFFGDVWEWTSSSYSPYPGYEPEPGAVGEYNGKFMINQMVLRGGSCVTPEGHIRSTYRNFFYPPDRWQFTGVRLAEGIRQ